MNPSPPQAGDRTLPPLTDPVLGPTAEAFDTLASVIYGAETFEEVYGSIIRFATTLIEGCDHASIMVRGRGGAFATVASNDDIARAVDALERLHRQGPCLDAIVEDTPQMEADLTQPHQEWPAFATDVVRTTPVRSAAGFRIVAGNEKIGALNLFSDTVGGMDAEAADQAVILAAFASVAVGTLHRREQARTLALGLESNREIGKAVGLLMALHKVSDTEAFGMLRKASQDLNLKLAEVAREIVHHHNNGHTPQVR